MERFWPNVCFVCKCTEKIKRCSGCQMISYCGLNHQKDHLKKHRELCRIISTLMKEKGVVHLFEKLKDSDTSTWITRRKNIKIEVEKRLGRSLSTEENGMFQFPRACFVCHDTRQTNLKNCPKCPSASFCGKHPNSLVHDRMCPIMNNCTDWISHRSQYNLKMIDSSMEIIMAGTKLPETKELPTSMCDFFDHYVKLKRSIPTDMKIIQSHFISISLTIFSILEKLKKPLASEIVIHLDARSPGYISISKYWEVLLHLLPDVKILKIVHIESEITCKYEGLLCKKCRASKRRLFTEANSIPYERYMGQKDYQTPNVIAYFNVEAPEKNNFQRKAWEITITRMSKVTCPIAKTFLEERGTCIMKEHLLSSTNFEIIYNGYNEFAPISYFKELDDGSFIRDSQFLFIFRQKVNQSKSSKLSEGTKSLKNPDVNRPRSFFYASICHVCHSENPTVTCNRCRMIFYCGNKHRDQHQIHHKDICKVILSMLKEIGASNIFDKFKTADPELWLEAKIKLLRKAESKLGRKLEEYEEQMFLFPKTCIVCHESDLSVLKSCKCGVNLCKIHKNDPKHKEICSELKLAFELTKSEELPVLQIWSKLPNNNRDEKMPSSMNEFIASHSKLVKVTSQYQDMLTSNFLTSPLTLLHAINKLDYKIDSSMIIHVIGAGKPDVTAEISWKMFLYWLRRLKTLKIVFIGPEIPNCPETEVNTSDYWSIEVKNLKVKSHALRYDEYFKSKSFTKPNIILGCNLDIHESELGIYECTWKETMLVLEKLGVPFILTAGTEERIQKDHKRFCKLLGKSIDYKFCEPNPYSVLGPERDFETEGIKYSNKYLIIYDGKYENCCKLQKKEVEKIIDKAPDVQNSEVEEKLPDFSVIECKSEIVEEDPKIKNIECGTKTEEEQLEIAGNELMKKNLLLGKENKLLREKLNLQEEENKKLVNKYLNLEKEYVRVQEENCLIKDIRRDVMESVRSAINEKKY